MKTEARVRGGSVPWGHMGQVVAGLLFAVAISLPGGVQAQGGVTPLPVTPGPAVTFESNGNQGGGAAEILSDTRGVDFQPYLHGLLKQIYTQWTSLMPDEARKPTLARGETDIRFKVRPNGEIASMVLDASARDEALDKAAWGAIAGAGPFAPLPSAFTGPFLEMRLHFRVNLPEQVRR